LYKHNVVQVTMLLVATVFTSVVLADWKVEGPWYNPPTQTFQAPPDEQYESGTGLVQQAYYNFGPGASCCEFYIQVEVLPGEGNAWASIHYRQGCTAMSYEWQDEPEGGPPYPLAIAYQGHYEIDIEAVAADSNPLMPSGFGRSYSAAGAGAGGPGDGPTAGGCDTHFVDAWWNVVPLPPAQYATPEDVRDFSDDLLVSFDMVPQVNAWMQSASEDNTSVGSWGGGTFTGYADGWADSWCVWTETGD